MALSYEYLKGIQNKNGGASSSKTASSSKGDGGLSYEYLKGIQQNRASVQDIAPIRTTTTTKKKKKKKDEEERTWFKSGEFADGYDFGDISKTILGSSTDLVENLGTSIIGMGEKALDSLLMLGTAMNNQQMTQSAQNQMMYNAVTGKETDGILERSLADQRQIEKETAEYVKKDLYDEEKIAKKIITNPVEKVSGINVEDASVFGEKSDSLIQSGGQLLATAGLQAVGVPWFLTTGATAFGSQAEQSLNEGATFNEANASALISAGAEILTEKLSGGIKFGGKTLDDVLVKSLTEKISSKTLKTLTNLGLDAVGEGSEEVVSSIMSNLGTALYKEDKVSDILFSEEAVDEYIESFIGGSVLGGVSSGFRAVRNGVEKTYTENEQKVIDKEVENRIAEEEQDGNKLSKRAKDKIREEVMNALDEGSISIDTIESVLGGEEYNNYKAKVEQENALQEQFDKLYKMKRGDMTTEQIDMLESLKQELEDYKSTTNTSSLKEQLSNNVYDIAKNSRLVESYNEQTRRGQTFEADLSKYDEKQRVVVQKAIDSRILNNTNRTHRFVDMIAKISADKGVLFDFTSNEKLKDSEFAVDGKTVNGFVNNDGDIVLNIHSSKALSKVAGHEITHILEGTELYTELEEIVKQYATTKGEYAERMQSLRKMYTGIYEGKDFDEKIRRELTADIVGDYIFTDSKFIDSLSTEKPNLFKKIYNEIKYLCKIATAGSKEARELEKVKRTFDKVYKESGKAPGNTKYSVSENTENNSLDDIKAKYKDKTDYLFLYEKSNTDTVAIENMVVKKEYRNQGIGSQILNDVIAYADKNGKTITLTPTTEFGTQNKLKKWYKANGFVENKGRNADYRLSDTMYRLPKGNTKYSLSDSDGKQLTKEQQDYFKDSKVRDDNGNLLKVYHGSPNEFTTFKQGVADGWGKGIYFTDNQSEAKSYGENVVEAYLNITNPYNADTMSYYDIGAENTKAYQNYDKKVWKEQGEYDTYEEYKADGMSVDIGEIYTEEVEVFNQILRELGYDGIIADGSNGIDGLEIVAFNENQPKLTTNTNPTSSPDIRYSVSDDSRVFRTPYGVEVVQNPTNAEYRQMREEIYKAYPHLRGTGEGILRHTYDEEGNEYYWNAYDGMHSSVEPYINKHYNTRTSQHPDWWNRPNKDSYPSDYSDIRYSLSDSEGNSLTEEQQKFFKNSQIRDDNGSLKVMYHGSQETFTVFDKKKARSGGTYGKGFYFTDSTSHAGTYGDIYDVYLNITNPLQNGTNNITKDQLRKFVEALAEDEDYGIENYGYGATIDSVTDSIYGKSDFGMLLDLNISCVGDMVEAVELFNKVNGTNYDGIVAPTETVAFYPNQIKKVDNKAPTSNSDIRFSLSEADNKYLSAVEKGDTETAQKLVDEVAKENGYTIKAFHGGYKFFTVFGKGNKTSQAPEGAHFFSSNKDVAYSYTSYKRDVNTDVNSYPVYKQLTKEGTFENNRVARGGVYSVFLKLENPYVVDFKGEYFSHKIDGRDINEIAKYAQENGYDGVIAKNIKDPGDMGDVNYESKNTLAVADDYIVFNSNQIKSSEAVTYDDNGNILSLSERFKAENNDIRYSLSNKDEIAPTLHGKYNVYGKDIAYQPTVSKMEQVEKDILPVQEGVAKNATTIPEEFAPMTEEEFNEVNESYRDRLNSLTDEEALPFKETPYYEENTVTLPQKRVDDIAKSVYDYVFPKHGEKKVLKDVIRKYANSEIADRYALFDEIKKVYGEKTYTEEDVDLLEVQNVIRAYPLKITDDIKAEYPEYADFMRSHRGRLRFSKDGERVDQAYQELSNLYPGYFPDTIWNSADQFRKIVEVAEMDRFSTDTMELLDEDIQKATDIIADEVDKFKANSISNEETAIRREAEAQNREWLNEFVPTKATQITENTPVGETRLIKTVKERLSEKLSGIERELADEKQLQRESIAEFNYQISQLQEEYAGKKDKNTKTANNILRRIEKLQRIRDSVSADYSKRISDLEARKTKTSEEYYSGESATEQGAMRRELHQSIIDNISSKFTEKGYDFIEVLKKAKNLSTFKTVDNTPQRVMEKALGYKEGQILADETVNKVAQNETKGIQWLNSFTGKNGVLAQLSKQYNIKPGSKKSAVAQMYAEGFYVNENNEIIKYGDEELAIDFPNAQDRADIKGLANDPRIRQIYDETLSAINESRSRNAYPEIQRLDNYFLHFRAMEDTFSRLGLPFNPNDIRAKDLPTDLNGVTADLKPGQPYFASAMHRKGMRTSFDLLGGLEKYLSSAKNQIYHIDDIQTLRALRNYIADTYGQAKGLESLDNLTEEEVQERLKQVYDSHLSTFAKFLNEEANVIAGKTALIDRGLEGIIGRRGITFLDTVNKQVGSNMVGFNVSSSLTNILPVVQTFAKTNKFDFVKALAQTTSDRLSSLYGKTDGFRENSPVVIRRKGADRFYRTPFQKVGDTGYILMSAVDDISTEIIARTKYNELTRKGMDSQQAHFETDKWVSRLMGDRSLGQQPQVFNSKMLGMVTKFQLEVRNQLDSQFYDTVQEAKVSNEEIENALLKNAKTSAKVASTFFQLAVLQHLFGKAFESVAGYNPAFDIVEALIKTFGLDDDEEDEDTALDNIEEGFLTLLDDLPYASTFTGGRIPISSALPIKELIKGEDEYGNEKSRVETLKETAPYYLLPTGYGQVKKTMQGLKMFDDDLPIAGSYTDSGNLRFPVDDTLKNRVQVGVFGQYANKNARAYFDDDIAPLKEKQIKEFVDVEMPIADYWKYREGLKDFSKQDEKVDYINGLDISEEQKNVLKSYLYDEEGYKEENPEKYAFLESEGIGFLGYKELDEETQQSWSWAFKNQEEYRHLKENGVYPEDYSVYYVPMQEFDDEGDKAYQWSYDNPEKATLGKVFSSGVKEYREYTSKLDEFRADEDSDGKKIRGSAKEKKYDYIFNQLDIDYGAKCILWKREYDTDDTYNDDIVDYLNNRDDISSEDMITILKELGATVDAEGNIYW